MAAAIPTTVHVELDEHSRRLLAEVNAAARPAPRNREAERQAILNRFDTFTLTVEQQAELCNSRESFRDMATFVLEATKPGREQSLALTALEEAKYWTNQSIAKDGVPE